MRGSWRGYLMILLSAIGFGSYGLWSRFIGAEFGVFSQAWVRSALILAILIPIAFFTKNFKKIESSDRKWLLIAVLFGTATQAPLYYAFNHMDIGTATLVFYALFVIISYLVGSVFLGEHITVPKIVSLVLAAWGLVIIFGFTIAKFSLLALFLAALNGIASGGEVAMTKKSTQKFSSLQVSVYMWAAILITHVPLALIFGEHQVPFALNDLWLSMIAYSLVGLTSFWLVIEGYKYVDASIGGLIGLLEIIFGVVFGIIFFQEQLTASIVIGGFLIILAAMLPDLVLLSSRYTKRVRKHTQK